MSEKDKYDYTERTVLSIMPKYRNEAIRLSHVQTLLGLSNREVKMAVQHLREDYPIVFKEKFGGGYWMAENSEQLREAIGILTKRRNALDITIGNLNNHYVGMLEKELHEKMRQENED